jgi:hypothetical protein
MTISKDRVKPSPLPDSWKLNEIFATGVVLGTYLALMTVVFFWAMHKTDFFTVSSKNFLRRSFNCCIKIVFWCDLSHQTFFVQNKFGVRSIRDSEFEMMSALYLQVSIVSQALIFVTRSRSWSFVERPGVLLVTAFFLAQLVRAKTATQQSNKYSAFNRKLNLIPFCRLQHSSLSTPTGNSPGSRVSAGDGLVLSGSSALCSISRSMFSSSSSASC